MVDLSTLKVGDTIVLRNGERHEVDAVYFNDYDYRVYSKKERAGNSATDNDRVWWHGVDGRWKAPKDRTRPGDIVEVIPANTASEPVSTGGVKHDSNKPDLSLLPSDVLWEVAEVLTHGAKVYGKYNWTKGFDYTRLQAAVLRHINQWSRGIDVDADTGKSHLSHALCGLMMLRAMELRGLGNDDRDTTGFKKE